MGKNLEKKEKSLLLIGTSGWSYKHWVERFYPKDLKPKDLLSFYAQHFPTVEINATFYRLPFEAMVKGWYKKTPDDFLFALKVSRVITHYKKLRDIEDAWHTYFNRLEILGKKRGVFLHQLPPSLLKDIELLEKYLKFLPKNFYHCVEFRHKSWFEDEVFKTLRKYNIAFCIISMPKMPVIFEVTAPFVYIRMHGSQSLYSSCYTEKEIKYWAGKIKKFLKQNLRVFVYFNNDTNAYAVFNAQRLKELLEKSK